MSNWNKAIGGVGGGGFFTTLAATAPWALLVIVIIIAAMAIWLVNDQERAERWNIVFRGKTVEKPNPPPQAPPRRRRFHLKRRSGEPP